jgi:hypothetical protein
LCDQALELAQGVRIQSVPKGRSRKCTRYGGLVIYTGFLFRCSPTPYNVTAHPAAEWTLQQFREALPGDHPYRFIIHDRDRIFAAEVDKGLAHLGVRVLRTPVRSPKANSVCERLGGSLRRECLDLLIPFHERHLQMILREWTTHYNRGRPHAALGPGLPEPMSEQVPSNEHRHSLPFGYRVVKRSVLGGLHHEYGLVREAA